MTEILVKLIKKYLPSVYQKIFQEGEIRGLDAAVKYVKKENDKLHLPIAKKPFEPPPSPVQLLH